MQNQLNNHPAPYLALHGDDPVYWQRWGQDALDLARRENKLLYLSVGYFACHWCHVMQQESYQDQGIAAILNQSFVSVKIDRELEPALDDRLMAFAQRILGRGGWPLNVFITPDGYPVYAVLYMPKDQFGAVLKRLQELWTTQPQRIKELVQQETETEFDDAQPDLEHEWIKQVIAHSVPEMLQSGDFLQGGFGDQSKFLSVPQLNYLLQGYAENAAADQSDPTLTDFLGVTLDEMAKRGLQDHLDGGFFRYSVDPSWSIPHFEKMLYDNANLASLYLHAATAMQNNDYLIVARRTLDFLRRRMWHPDGALVASFSAVDANNIEGGYYLWQPSELQQILEPSQFAVIVKLWGLDRPAELAAGNHPRYESTIEQVATELDQAPDEIQLIVEQSVKRLLARRDTRSLPVDDKLLAGWNGLALTAFAQAAQQLDDGDYRAVAQALRDFIVKRLWDGKQLSRALVKQEIFGSAALEDYAYVAAGLYRWALLSEQAEDYRLATTITQLGWQKFYRGNAWYSQDKTLLAPPAGEEIVADDANPSPAAVLIHTSLQLAEHNNDQALREQALSALNRGRNLLTVAPFWFASQLAAIKSALSSR